MQQPNSPIITRSVDFYGVHRLVAPILHEVESWPFAGTLAWQALADTDPAKWAAVLDVARYGALHLQLRQEAFASAAKEIATTENWATQARRIRGRATTAYIKRKETA